MRINANKQNKKNISGESKEKKFIQKNFKEKINKDNNTIDNYKLYPNIDNKIQNIKSNAAEKMKLYTKSIEQRIKEINTESIFKTKKTNNYQPISSKNSNSNGNPFRNSSREINQNTNRKNNILSIKKMINTNLGSNPQVNSLIKERHYSNHKEKAVINSDYDKNKNQKKHNIIITKIKNINDKIEKNKVNDNNIVNNDIINNNENKNEKIIYKNDDNDKDNKETQKEEENLSETNRDNKVDTSDVDEQVDIKKINIINYNKGTDYYKEKMHKIKMNGKNDFMIENEIYERKIVNNSSYNNNKEKSYGKNNIKEYSDNEGKNNLQNNKNEKYNNEKINEIKDNEENGEINGIIKNEDYNNIKHSKVNKKYDNNNEEKEYEEETQNNNDKMDNLPESKDLKNKDNNISNEEYNDSINDNSNEIINYEEAIDYHEIEENKKMLIRNKDKLNKYIDNTNSDMNGNEENKKEEINIKVNKVIKEKEKENDNDINKNIINIQEKENMNYKDSIKVNLNKKEEKNNYYKNLNGINDKENDNIENLKNMNIINNGKEINIFINENNSNGKEKEQLSDKKYKQNIIKEKEFENYNIKNNGIETPNNSNYKNENKIIEFNLKKNKTKEKYDIIEIPVNESNKIKPKPKLREKSIKTDKFYTIKEQTSKNIASTQEINSVSNILNSIKELIIKSKEKVEKDLDKIQKIGKQKNIIINKNKIKDDKKSNNSNKKSNSKNKILKNYNNNINDESQVNDIKENQHILNKRYDENLKPNNNINNEINIENNEIKIDNNNNDLGYKKVNEVTSKKFSTQIDNNFINDYLNNNSNNNHDFGNKKEELNKDNLQKVSQESSSQKKNYRNKKYDDIDLNTFFSKSIKKEERKSVKQNVNNYRFIEENGGILIEKEKKIKTIEEEEHEQDIDNKIETKQEVLKKIIITTEIKNVNNNNINNLNTDSIDDDEKHKYKDKNELINMNKELIDKITILKKEVEFSKNEMRRKDEKFLRYLNKFDKIASENAYNIVEIENLEEELLNRKNEMDLKTKKINELMNINMGLEQEMNQLKTYYKSKDSNNKILQKNNYNSIEDDNIENNSNNKISSDNEENNKYEEFYMEDEFEELNVDELHGRRNTLIKERNDITFLINKLPIKLVSKEQIRQKNEYENKLTRINNDLMKIRLQLKNFNQ